MFVVDYHYPIAIMNFKKKKDNKYCFILVYFVLFNFFIKNINYNANKEIYKIC